LAFKFRYVDGLVTPPSPAAFLGKQVHSSLETFYRHRQLGISLGMADLSQGLYDTWEAAASTERISFGSIDEEKGLQRQALALVRGYLCRMPREESPPLAVEVGVEADLVDPFTGEDFNIPLFGVIDLILDEEAGPRVIDFKTAARNQAPLEIAHELQLTAYSYLFRHNAGQEESGLEIRQLIKTKMPQVEFHPYPARSEAHFRRFFAVVRAYLHALNSGTFVYRPGWTCGMCDFRNHPCRDWDGQ
jgi:hypothetical protein